VTDAEKEKIKLRANFINGLAVGVVLIGTFTPITRAAYDPAMKGDAFLFMAGTGLVCFALVFILTLLRNETPERDGSMTIYNYLALAIPVVGIALVLVGLQFLDNGSKKHR